MRSWELGMLNSLTLKLKSVGRPMNQVFRIPQSAIRIQISFRDPPRGGGDIDGWRV